MAANGLVTTEADRILDNSIPTGSVLDLVTVMGTATAAPTKSTGGSYAAQTPTWNSAAAFAKTNSATVTFSGLAASTIVGTDLQNASSARTWFVPFATSKAVGAGDSIIFAATTGLSYSFANGT